MRAIIISRNGHRIVDLNRRKAIHERCLNCSGWMPSEVAECSFVDCPLFPFRTGVGKQTPAKRNRAIKDYCIWCMAGNKNEVKRCVSTYCPLFNFRGVSQVKKMRLNLKNEHIEANFEPKEVQAIPLYG